MLRDNLEIIGGVCSVAGVGVAILIAAKQDAQSQLMQRIILSETHRMLDGFVSQVATDPHSDLGIDEEDEFADATAVMDQHGLTLGSNVQALPAPEIPLGIIHEVVETWQSQQKTGDWKVGSLRGALRRTGKGNHPWYLVFDDPDGRRRLWRLSRGGQGKRESTLAEVEAVSVAVS